MKELNRTNFRPRTIDNAKNLQIVRDINDIVKKEDNSSVNWVGLSGYDYKTDNKSILEIEIKKIMDLFDKKKTIIIPKVEKFEKPAEKATSNGEGKFSTNTSYKQTEYMRPRHYIVYSEKNRIEPKEKDYEACVHDLKYLELEKYFISVEELEKIISALENDINKGEMIPQERVKDIILSIIPDKKQHVEKIIKYWNTRREVFKKSLLRKFWKDQKFTDKHLQTTFKRREGGRIKTRRNKKNEVEGLQKLKEIRESTVKYLVNIASAMKEREVAKKHLLTLQQFEYENEISSLFRSMNSNNEKSNLEEKWKEFKSTVKMQKLQVLHSPDPKPRSIVERHKDQENHPKHSLEKDFRMFPNPTIPNGKAENLSNTNLSSDVTSGKSFVNQNNIDNQLVGKKTFKKHNYSGNRLSRQPTGLKSAQESALTQQLIPQKPPQPEVFLKHRIRKNRANRIVIDRYIQAPNSFYPFDDQFNELLNRPAKYREDFVYNTQKQPNFNSFYNDFLQNKLNGVLVQSDSEDDLNSFGLVLRGFSSSFKSFLKQKRSYTEMSSS